jgi:hypothetical protein
MVLYLKGASSEIEKLSTLFLLTLDLSQLNYLAMTGGLDGGQASLRIAQVS